MYCIEGAQLCRLMSYASVTLHRCGVSSTISEVAVLCQLLLFVRPPAHPHLPPLLPSPLLIPTRRLQLPEVAPPAAGRTSKSPPPPTTDARRPHRHRHPSPNLAPSSPTGEFSGMFTPLALLYVGFFSQKETEKVRGGSTMLRGRCRPQYK